MAIYANVEDIEAEWRPLTDAEKVRADRLIERAGLRIVSECRDIPDRIESGEISDELLEAIVCAMVKRAMLASIDQPAMTQQQQSAGPFSFSGTFTNPTGDLYLTKAEKRMLGCGGQRAGSVNMIPLRD